jgi:hypothetical protein
MFRNAGHNSTKFFSSLELLITPPKNKQIKNTKSNNNHHHHPECP